jgi:hypothetical protein
MKLVPVLALAALLAFAGVAAADEIVCLHYEISLEYLVHIATNPPPVEAVPDLIFDLVTTCNP